MCKKFVFVFVVFASVAIVTHAEESKPSPSPSPAANLTTVKDVKALCKAEGKQGKELVDCMKEKSQ